MSLASVAEGRPAVSRLARRLLGPFRARETAARAVYLLLGGPLGACWLVLLTVGFLVGSTTAVLGVGVVVLLTTLVLGRALADVERRLANALLGLDIPAPVEALTGPDEQPSWRLAVRQVWLQPRTWRSLVWLLFRATAGLVVISGVLLSAVVLVALLAVPFDDSYLEWDLAGTTWRSTAGWASAWTIPVALAGLLGLAHLVGPLAAVHARVARLLLGPDPEEEAARLRDAVGRLAGRARVARDLHDSVGHALTLVVVKAEAARLTREDGGDADALAVIADTARAALDDLDTALAVLRDDPPQRRAGPGVAELEKLLGRARSAGLAVTARIDAVTDRHPASPVAYRVVQEACTNALRYARPAEVTVAISEDHGVLAVVVRSPLPSPVATVEGGRGGRGLAGLAERVRLAGGDLSAGPDGEGTWMVSARLPG